jgi:hypothetical protein
LTVKDFVPGVQPVDSTGGRTARHVVVVPTTLTIVAGAVSTFVAAAPYWKVTLPVVAP